MLTVSGVDRREELEGEGEGVRVKVCKGESEG